MINRNQRNPRRAWFGRGAAICHTRGFLSLIVHSAPRRIYRAYFQDSDRRDRKEWP